MKTDYFSVARDGLLVLPRMVSAGRAVARVQRKNRRIDRRTPFTSPATLAEVLGARPEEIETARIEEVHSGTATRSRLRIQYREGSSSPQRPTSLFLKSSPPDFSSGLFGTLFALGENEVAFYQRLRRDVPVRCPKVYFARGDSTDYIMLLEDLAEERASFRTLAQKCSADEATQIVTTLATLHASFWQSDRFSADLAWVNRFETNDDARLLNLVRNLSVPLAYDKFSEVLPAEIRAVTPHLMQNYGRLEQQWAQGPRTLLHGDAHLGNMYFQDGEAGLLDWQVTQYGQGMRDIAYFLVNSLETPLRLEHQERLVRHYLALLGAAGIELRFDTAWRQYRLQSVYAWIAGVVTAPSNFQEESVVVAGLERACTAVLDLDALTLIREL